MPICHKRTKNSSKEPFEWGGTFQVPTPLALTLSFFFFFFWGLENTAPLKIGKPDRHVLEKAYRLFIGLLGIWLNNIKFKTAKIWLKQHRQFLALYNPIDNCNVNYIGTTQFNVCVTVSFSFPSIASIAPSN